ncbi:MAG: hypothetical protein NTZ74_13460 [Chloroflexi bacterium]|nr:hypothetical protein [Chloroflexota bacterium]
MDSNLTDSGQQLPSKKAVQTTSLFLTLIGWVGLILLFVFTLPTLGPRWLLFFLTTLAFTGPFLPIVVYLHRRFPSKPAATAAILVREALWVGIYADFMIWLQFGKALNLALAALIAAGMLAVELLLRMRERSRWAPPEMENE